MAQDSPGWRYFRQWMGEKHAERMQERAWAHQLMMYEQERADQRSAEKKRQVWVEHREISSMFLQTYQQANTPAEKELIRNNWLTYAGTMPKGMRYGIEKLMANSPLSIQKINDAEWYRNNPSPPAPNFKPEENMHRYAQMVYAQEMHKAQFAKERRNQTYQVPKEIPMDADTYAYLDPQGNVQLEKYEVKNKFYDQLSEGTGMSGYRLMKNEGWTDPKITTVYRTDPNTGAQYQDIVSIEHNVETKENRVKKVFTGEIKKSTSTSRPRHEGPIMQPNEKASDFMGYLQTGVKPNKKREPLTRARWDRIVDFSEDVFKRYKKTEDHDSRVALVKEYEKRLNEELRGLDQRFVYTIIGPDEGTYDVKDPWGWVGPHFVLGKNAFIKAVYGKKGMIGTKDNKVISVVIDEEHDRVSLMDGTSLGTIPAATAMIGSHTVEELRNQ